MPEPKDVIITIFGASVALAGLLLVFSGLLFTQAAALPRTTDDAIINRFRRGARLACWPLLLALAIAGLCLAWLLCPGNIEYSIVWVSFVILLVATVAYAFWAAWGLL